MTQVTVEQLFIYPVKSCAGIELSEAELTPEGLSWDRSWMVIMPNGRFVTQRQMPQMAKIRVDFSEQALILGYEGEVFSVDLNPPVSEPITAKVWHDECQVLDEGTAVGEWLTRVLGSKQPLRLVCMQGDFIRPQSAPERFGTDTHTQFADAAPFLVTSIESLDALNQQLQQEGLEQVDMRHFRPNIVVSGVEAFTEQSIALLNNDGYNLKLCDPSSRCIMTTVNPDTGVKHPQMVPFKTLTSLNAMPNDKRVPAFGMNATLQARPDGSEGIIRVGDKLNVC